MPVDAARGGRRGPLGWSLFVAGGMITIVFTFVASTLVMRSRLNATAEAISVARNGGPSVRYIAAARTHLREQREAAGAYVFRDGGARAQQAMRESRRRLEQAITDELATPSYPGEKAIDGGVHDALIKLDAVTAPLHPSADLNEARKYFLAFQAATDRLDDRLAQLEDYNASYLAMDAESLLAKQRSAAPLTFLLYGISILLAAVVAAVVIAFLRRYLRMLDQRNYELEMFSARVAHDLMSPLATVSLALGANQAKLHDEDSIKKTRSALAALRRSRDVVDGLLNFARSGGKPGAGAHTSVNQVLKGVIDDARPAAEEAGIELIQEPSGLYEVACECGVLSVLVSNLLNNAIKFMDDAETRRITIRTRPLKRWVRIEVEDTGPGFPAAFESIVFDPYARATTRVPGLGLGLATVKRLVDAHGGRVGVEQRAGAGTRFWFELPRVASEPQRAPSAAPQPA